MIVTAIAVRAVATKVGLTRFLELTLECPYCGAKKERMLSVRGRIREEHCDRCRLVFFGVTAESERWIEEAKRALEELSSVE